MHGTKRLMVCALGISALLGVAIASGAELPPSASSPSGFSSERVSVAFNQILLSDFFQVISQMENTEVKVDACAANQKLTIVMKNVPVRLLVDAISDQLGLTYEHREGGLFVGCR